MTTKKGYRQARQVLKYRKKVQQETGKLLPIGQARKEWLIIQKLMNMLGGMPKKKAVKVLKAVAIFADIE